jgi:hypothetical protein
VTEDPDAHHLAEHFVPDDQLLLALRSLRASSGQLFAVGAANSYSDDPDLYVIRRGDGGLRPFHNARSSRTRTIAIAFMIPYLSLSNK